MTDEELAKTRSAEFTDERGIGYFSYHAGFLAGLEEGRPKWHDLRENPNNLPKEDGGGVATSHTVLDQYGDRCWYNYGKRQWENGNCRTDGTYDCNVVAWCEIPKFEEIDK